jgi:NAD(P)-dependent dehydrogenase (short-subunit alcohol dehydrogenase family)
MSEAAGRGRVVVITGAGRGIARQVALDFAAEGARVVVVDLVEERAKRTVAEIEAARGTALAVVCDVRDEASVARMVEEAVRAFGRIDVLVNAAGGYTAGRVSHQLSAQDWDLVLDSNLKGSFLTCKHVIPHMLRGGGGRIVNFSSNAGRTSSPALGVHYTAAKAGVLGLTRHLAKEYAAQGILVNTLAPGPALVERNFEIMTEEAREQLRKDIPLGRYAEPSDLSAAVRFLASEGARHITGATLDVNGGYVMV